jgi:DNA end-binding protein Ku
VPERSGKSKRSAPRGRSAAAKGPKRADDRREAAAADDDAPQRPRSFWSGNIAFGLVSVPVSLFVANRSSGTALRMVGADGTPLARRYFCSAEDRPVDNDEIVRGFEIADDHFVVVEDDELAALAPEKSQEIDLRRFVPREQIDPMYFERAYFLVPDRGASKAYRLLARIMEDTGRAGIATFVMRGKEYLVAIIAERGLLRAETMRFHDELRTPADVGLPEIEKAPAAEVERLERAIADLAADELDRESLRDQHGLRLRALAERKLAAGEDVVAAEQSGGTADAADEDGGADVVDLMQVLKRSLADEDDQARTGNTQSRRGSPTSDRKAPQRAARAGNRQQPDQDLEELPKSALYDAARELDIAGRSSMSRNELIRAIRARR